MYAHIQDSMLHTRATDRTFRSFVHPRALSLSARRRRPTPDTSPGSLSLPVSIRNLRATLSSTASRRVREIPRGIYIYGPRARTYLLSPVAVMARPPPSYLVR